MNHMLSFKHERMSYSLSFNSQLNVILGDSSTGKTIICQYISRKKYTNLESTGKVIIVKDYRDIKYAEDNSILLIDSDNIETEDLLDIIKSIVSINNNSICIVYIGRNHVQRLPLAVQNLFKLVTNNNRTTNVRVVKDDELLRIKQYTKLVVEDSKSGYNFFKSIISNTVSSYGNTRLIDYISKDNLLIFDSVGFGAYILEFLEEAKGSGASYIGYLSFEGFILENVFKVNPSLTGIDIEKSIERQLRGVKGSYSKSLGCTGDACAWCDNTCRRNSRTVLRDSKYGVILDYYKGADE